MNLKKSGMTIQVSLSPNDRLLTPYFASVAEAAMTEIQFEHYGVMRDGLSRMLEPYADHQVNTTMTSGDGHTELLRVYARPARFVWFDALIHTHTDANTEVQMHDTTPSEMRRNFHEYLHRDGEGLSLHTCHHLLRTYTKLSKMGYKLSQGARDWDGGTVFFFRARHRTEGLRLPGLEFGHAPRAPLIST
jgi:hypothetical protein